MARDSNTFGHDPYAETGPIDIAAVRRDDMLIDAIAGDGPVATDSADEYRLAALLAEWRAEIVSPALPQNPDIDAVCAALESSLARSESDRRTRNHMRLLRPIAGAAAAVAFVIGGVTAISYNAMPGDPLWKVKEVVFTQQADSTVAQVDSTTTLQDAEKLIASGDVSTAKVKLDEAARTVPNVGDSAEREQLTDWWNRLSDELDKLLNPTPAPTPAPSTSATTTSTTGSAPTTSPSYQLPTLPIPSELPQLPTEIPSFTLPFPLPSLPFPLPGQAPAPTSEPSAQLQAPVTTTPAAPSSAAAPTE
ncbi:anti-sigma-D factor RsdA [Actinomycetes bacterium M1A6_2h]